MNDLRSEKSGANRNTKDQCIVSLSNLEKKYAELENKYKDQMNINSELADKIQQLEFDKDMMYKENTNLK